MPHHVNAIATAGVRSIVNLVAICEARSIAYVHHLPPSIYWLHLAFWDGYLGANRAGYPERLTEGFARHIVQKAAAVLRDRSPVLVHCMGGIGRAGNVATLLLAASEGMTLDEANLHIRRYRPVVAPFAHEGFWKEAGSEELLALARNVLAEPSNYPQNVSPFLADGWRLSPPIPPGDVTVVPYPGVDRSNGWTAIPAMSEFVDIHELSVLEGIVYLARTVRVEEDGEWILHIGHDGGIRLFVDGQPLTANAGLVNPAPYQRTQARVSFRKGDHEIVIAFDRAAGLGWGIFACFEPSEAMQAIDRAIAFPR